MIRDASPHRGRTALQSHELERGFHLLYAFDQISHGDTVGDSWSTDAFGHDALHKLQSQPTEGRIRRVPGHQQCCLI